jgi:hypothetical protein
MTPEFVEHIGWKRSVGKTKYEPAEMNRQYIEVILPEEFVMTMERCIGFPDIPQNFVELQLDQSLMRPNDFNNMSFRWTYSHINYAGKQEARYELADMRQHTAFRPKDTVSVSLPSKEDVPMPCQVWLEWNLQDSDEWLKSNSVKYHWHGVLIDANIDIDDIEVSSANDEKIIEVKVDLQLKNPFPYRKEILLSYDDEIERIWIPSQDTISQKIRMKVSDNMEITLTSTDELRTFQNESISGEKSIYIGLENEDFEIEIDKIIQNGRELEIVMNSNAPLLNYNIEPSLKIIRRHGSLQSNLEFIKEQGDSLFFKDSSNIMKFGRYELELHVNVIDMFEHTMEERLTYLDGDLSIYSEAKAVQQNDHLEVQVDFHFQSSMVLDTQAEIVEITFDNNTIIPSWKNDLTFTIPKGNNSYPYFFAIPMFDHNTGSWLKKGGKFSFTVIYNGGDGKSKHEYTVLNEETFVCMELSAPDWRNKSQVLYGNPKGKENELDFWYQFRPISLRTYSKNDYGWEKDPTIQIEIVSSDIKFIKPSNFKYSPSNMPSKMMPNYSPSRDMTLLIHGGDKNKTECDPLLKFHKSYFRLNNKYVFSGKYSSQKHPSTNLPGPVPTIDNYNIHRDELGKVSTGASEFQPSYRERKLQPQTLPQKSNNSFEPIIFDFNKLFERNIPAENNKNQDNRKQLIKKIERLFRDEENRHSGGKIS